MSVRKSRRALVAELISLSDPLDIHVYRDGTGMSVDFDSIAELRSWLHAAGLDGPDLRCHEHIGTNGNGRTYRNVSVSVRWHGWKVYAHATEYPSTRPLDPSTADRLTTG